MIHSQNLNDNMMGDISNRNYHTMNDTAHNSTIRDYITLMKPRVMSLVVFSGLIGLLIAPGELHWFIGFVTIICIGMASGSASAINMWYDADIDSVMERTKQRPTVTGVIAPLVARDFGIILGFVAIIIMATCVNITASLLLLAAILFYVFIYTIWLKRISTQNVVIGGAAGAFPPMIGWVATTGSISIESVILFMIIFTWTPPHTWALSLYKADDYRKANIPMLPIVKGDLHTKQQILLYSILMILTTFLPYYYQMSGLLYLTSAIILGIFFIYYAIILFYDSLNTVAPRLFGFSIIYLFMILTMLYVDSLIINY